MEGIDESDGSDTELDVDSGSEGEDAEEQGGENLKEKENKKWKKGGWRMDPNIRPPYGPILHLQDKELVRELGYLLHFFPKDYLVKELLPAMNSRGSKNPSFQEISFAEFMTFLGLTKIMEVVKLPNRRMYWEESISSLIPAFEFSKHMSCRRYEVILTCLRMSDDEVLQFINAVNEQLESAITPGNVVTLDESMIKSFHKNLKGKIKIRRKPRPVGNEIKDMSDARTNIVVKLEMYEGKEDMALKEHVGKFGATCATTLRLTKSLHGSGRIVVADSWFGSVKTSMALRDEGLYAVMLVKTAHKRYPRTILAQHKLKMGEWVSYTAKLDGEKGEEELMACSFQDLKLKHFISTCCTTLAGNPRKTKHHGDVQRPQVAEFYLAHAASIDVHNHVRTGSLGFEDVLMTLSPTVRQFTGIVGFLFTNSFLAYKYFKNDQDKLSHCRFKIQLAEQLVAYRNVTEPRPRRSLLEDSVAVASSHQLVKLEYPKPCYYCRHGYKDSSRKTTTFECSFCKVPLHKASYKLKCWEFHITYGLPEKRRSEK